MRNVILNIFFRDIPKEHLKALPLDVIYAVSAALLVAGGVLIYDVIRSILTFIK